MAETFTAVEVRSMILDEVSDWGSQKALAARMGVSPAYLSDVLSQRREPGPKIAAYFDLQRVILYRAEIRP